MHAAAQAAERPAGFALDDPVRHAVERLAMGPQACAARAYRNVREGACDEALPDIDRLLEMFPDSPTYRAWKRTCERGP